MSSIFDNDIGRQEHKPVDAALCCKWIEHSIKELEAWILRSGPKGSQYHPHDFPDAVGQGGLRGKKLHIPVAQKESVCTLSALEGGTAQRKVPYFSKA